MVEVADQAPSEEDDDNVNWPVPVIPLPGVHDVQPSMTSDNEPIVCMAFYTPGGAIFVQYTREDALKLASDIRKVAQTGASLTD